MKNHKSKTSNKQRTPQISVLMSVYNGEAYLTEAIDSILNQTFRDFEFLIINDGSSDNSLQILNKYETADSRVRIINNEENIGLTESLNKGLREAKGEYIARMDADDISLSTRFEKQVKFMDDNQDVVVCGAWLKTFGSSKNIWEFPHTYEHIKVTLMFNSCIGHPSAFIRASFIKKNRISYNQSFKTAQDYDLWERIIYDYEGRIVNFPEVLLYYRLHENNIGFISGPNQGSLADKIRLRQLERLFGEEADTFFELHKKISKWDVCFSKEELNDVKNYFYLLISKNYSLKIYENSTLELELSQKFFSICRRNTQLGLFSYQAYKKNIFGKSSKVRLSKAMEIKFLLKAMLRN